MPQAIMAEQQTESNQTFAVFEEAKRLTELGYCVQPTRGGSKHVHRGWTLSSARRLSEEDLEKHFAKPKPDNLAILSGEQSGGLAVVDFDDEEAYKKWAEKFALFARELPTVRTQRGYHVHCRIQFQPISSKDQVGTPPGVELIYGQLALVPPSILDATAYRYEWINEPAPVHELRPLTAPQLLLGATYGATRNFSGPFFRPVESVESVKSVESVESVGAWSSKQIHKAVHACRCTKRKTRDAKLWALARCLKSIAKARGEDLSRKELYQAAKQWHELSERFLSNAEYDAPSAAEDLARKYSYAKSGHGESPATEAFRLLKTEPAGEYPELEIFESNDLCRLADFMRHFQSVVGPGRVFFCPQREIAVLLGFCKADDPRLDAQGRRVSRLLGLLEREGLIAIVDRGGIIDGKRKAKEFRWIREEPANTASQV